MYNVHIIWVGCKCANWCPQLSGEQNCAYIRSILYIIIACFLQGFEVKEACMFQIFYLVDQTFKYREYILCNNDNL